MARPGGEGRCLPCRHRVCWLPPQPTTAQTCGISGRIRGSKSSPDRRYKPSRPGPAPFAARIRSSSWATPSSTLAAVTSSAASRTSWVALATATVQLLASVTSEDGSDHASRDLLPTVEGAEGRRQQHQPEHRAWIARSRTAAGSPPIEAGTSLPSSARSFRRATPTRLARSGRSF